MPFHVSASAFARAAVKAARASFFLLAMSSPSLAQEPLRIQGSTTFFDRLLKPNKERIETIAATKLEVVPNKSIWGLIALLERRADLAMISAGLSGEIAVAKRNAPDLPYDSLMEFPISQTPIAFAVHPSNPVRVLSDDQLRRILAGEITRWSEVGGPDIEIRVVATQDGGGTVVAVRAQLLGGEPIRAPNAIRPESARHVVQAVAQEPGALGIAQARLVKASGLPEISPQTPVLQTLTFVASGPPSRAVAAVIAATKTLADEDPQ